MLGSTRNVFRSRWRALVWSAGICLTAYCTVPGEGDGESGVLAEAARIAGEAADAQDTPRKANPWALQPRN